MRVALGLTAIIFAVVLLTGMTWSSPEPPTTVKFGWHEGTALLKSGLKIKGEFRFREPKASLPFYEVKDLEVPGQKNIFVTMFASLSLAGAERGASASRDSSHFHWMDEYNDLMRLVRDGDLQLYDNSKIIDEDYAQLADYILLGKHDKFGVRKIRRVDDLGPLMQERPYFIQAAKATGKLDSRDYGIIVYLCDLFNDKQPMKYLRWPEVTFEDSNGKEQTGFGLVQPVDLRNEYGTDDHAYLHFFDGAKFSLLKEQQLSNLQVNEEQYATGFFGLTNKNFFGIEWDYNGEKFLVVKKVSDSRRFYFSARDSGPSDYTVMKRKSGTYVLPENEMSLRKIFWDLTLSN
ncbi:hypothetical protein N8482_01055 [Chitinophagales bacterium]|nr:hypothetical protein [Chitinophagales bacterium]